MILLKFPPFFFCFDLAIYRCHISTEDKAINSNINSTILKDIWASMYTKFIIIAKTIKNKDFKDFDVITAT